jgi:hypothetical protein
MGAVHHGPVAAVAHNLISVRPRQHCGSSSLVARSSGAKVRCDEPILGVSRERVALGRGGQRWRRLREKQRWQWLS